MTVNGFRPGPLAPMRDIKARMPPSPRLSARITNRQYLIEIVMMSVQTISDSVPRAPAATEMSVHRLHHRLQRVQGTRAQIAEHDAERREHRPPQRCAGDSGGPRGRGALGLSGGYPWVSPYWVGSTAATVQARSPIFGGDRHAQAPGSYISPAPRRTILPALRPCAISSPTVRKPDGLSSFSAHSCCSSWRSPSSSTGITSGPTLARIISEKTGRHTVIRGNLRVHLWSFEPSAQIDGLDHR